MYSRGLRSMSQALIWLLSVVTLVLALSGCSDEKQRRFKLCSTEGSLNDITLDLINERASAGDYRFPIRRCDQALPRCIIKPFLFLDPALAGSKQTKLLYSHIFKSVRVVQKHDGQSRVTLASPGKLTIYKYDHIRGLLELELHNHGEPAAYWNACGGRLRYSDL